MTATWRILLASLALIAAGEPVRASEIELRGSVRSRLGLTNPVLGNDYRLELRARPELVVYLKDRLSATITLRGERNWGALEDALGEGEVELDRAFLDVQHEKWDFRIGRQAVNFGQALIWNPVDLVDSNSPLDFDVVKEGIDAFRASYAVSSTTNVLGLVAFPDGGPLSLVRGETLFGSADMGFLVAHDARDDDTVVGFDVKGDLVVGYWAEAAYHDLERGEDFYQWVVGVDYSFAVLDQLYLAVQYYQDSSGGTSFLDYDLASLAAGRRRFLAKQYGSLLSSLTMNELTSASASLIYNLEDKSHVVTLSLQRYFFENLEVSLRGSLFDGSGPGEYNPVSRGPLMGRQPSEVYELYLEWHF